MQNVIPFMGKKPQIGREVYVDPSCRVIGRVILRRGCSVWPMSVLRADSNQILIEEEAVILDKVLIEAPAEHPVVVGRRALISHGAILHGCTVGEGALVGIGAIVLDGAAIGRSAIIGAGSLVPPGTAVPENSLVLGIPGRVIRDLRPEEIQRISAQVTESAEKAAKYRLTPQNS